MLRPHFYCLTSRFTHVRSLQWVLGLCGIRQGYGCLGNDRRNDSSADSSASLAQCCSCGGFFPSFAIFALLWGLLLFLGLLAFIPRLHFWCCLFRSACLFSSSLSPPVASIVCFSCWPPSLLVRVWLWGPAWYSFMFGLTFLHLLICFAARCTTNVCVSSLRFGSGLYDEAGFLGGSHVGLCGSGS